MVTGEVNLWLNEKSYLFWIYMEATAEKPVLFDPDALLRQRAEQLRTERTKSINNFADGLRKMVDRATLWVFDPETSQKVEAALGERNRAAEKAAKEREAAERDKFWKDVQGSIDSATDFAGDVCGTVVDGLGQTLNAVNEGVGEVIGKGLGWIGTESQKAVEETGRQVKELGKDVVNLMGREVVAPILTEVAKPAVGFVDDLHEYATDVSAGLLEYFGTPMETQANNLRDQISQSPDVVMAVKEAANFKRRNGEKSFLGRLITGYVRLAEQGQELMLNIATKGEKMRGAAREIRGLYDRESKKREQAAGAIGDAARIVNQGI